MNRSLLMWAAAVTALVIPVWVVLQLLLEQPVSVKTAVLAAVASLWTLSLTLIVWLRAVRHHRRTFDVALIGPPNAGKTVYLTVLFRELERGGVGGLLFAPQGTETIRRVSDDLTRMAEGFFPPKTQPGRHFFYEAVARYRGRLGLLDREYRIKIADFAGESLEELIDDSPKSEFLAYVLNSQAIFIMIDCEEIAHADRGAVARSENQIASILNCIMSRKNVDRADVLRIPVALLLSKADVLDGEEAFSRGQLLDELQDVLSVCKAKCRHFRFFFVSSVGVTPREIEGRAAPPARLSPRGVLHPLLWVLGSGSV